MLRRVGVGVTEPGVFEPELISSRTTRRGTVKSLGGFSSVGDVREGDRDLSRAISLESPDGLPDVGLIDASGYKFLLASEGMVGVLMVEASVVNP